MRGCGGVGWGGGEHREEDLKGKVEEKDSL